MSLQRYLSAIRRGGVAYGPETYGLLGWSADLAFFGANVAPAAATIYLARIETPKPIAVTNLHTFCGIAGTSYTNAQLGLYSSSGAFIGACAVQASAGTNGFGTTGWKTLAIVGGPVAINDTFVWAAAHFGTNAATTVSLRGGPFGADGVNGALPAASARWGTFTGHATNPLATIGNITPASIAKTTSLGMFCLALT